MEVPVSLEADLQSYSVTANDRPHYSRYREPFVKHDV